MLLRFSALIQAQHPALRYRPCVSVPSARMRSEKSQTGPASTHAEAMVRPASSVSDVALVWKYLDHTSAYSMRVSLQEIEDASCCGDIVEPVDEGDDTGHHIPASVLMYERQLRKAQHAKKAGKRLDSSDLRVIYEDEALVVVNKPAGVLTVPGINGNPSLLDLVFKRYGGSVADPQTMIVHRLDMDTSGLVVFSRSPDITRKLHAMFREQQVSKQYICLVMGCFPLPSDMNMSARILIDLPLQRDHENPPFMRVSTPRSERAAMDCVAQLQKHGWKKLVRKRPKPSQTIVSVMEYGSMGESSLPFTRLRLEPVTGRTHQLRVHWYVGM
jgi:tRNA pseudouridine32 synthase / 23S rRNA pseudouridine746 synthase